MYSIMEESKTDSNFNFLKVPVCDVCPVRGPGALPRRRALLATADVSHSCGSHGHRGGHGRGALLSVQVRGITHTQTLSHDHLILERSFLPVSSGEIATIIMSR